MAGDKPGFEITPGFNKQYNFCPQYATRGALSVLFSWCIFAPQRCSMPVKSEFDTSWIFWIILSGPCPPVCYCTFPLKYFYLCLSLVQAVRGFLTAERCYSQIARVWHLFMNKVRL